MPYTKQELITLYSLDLDEVNQTLTAAELSENGESYTDEQIQTGFELIRSYFSSGQVGDYAAAAELFKQHQTQQQLEADVQAKTKKSTKGKKSENSNGGVVESEQLNVVELLAHASQQVGSRISLTEAVQIFNACGLPDKEQYSYLECDRFVEACSLTKQENKTIAEVAMHFGFNPQMDDLELEQVGKIIEGMEAQASLLTDELLLESAASKALSDAQKYMLYYATASAEGEQVKQFWARLREHAKTRMLGKAQARLSRAEPQPTFILPSSPNLTDSFENSKNGTTGV